MNQYIMEKMMEREMRSKKHQAIDVEKIPFANEVE